MVKSKRERAIFAERVHRLDDARPRHERAEDRQEERHDDERHVPDAQHAALLLHADRVQERRRGEPRQQPGVLNRIPHPVAAPPELLVRPQHAKRQPERQEQPAEHRPAAHGAQPGVVEMPGDERGQAEGERDRHRHEADVHRRRVDGHVEVLEQRRQPAPVGRRRRQERRERVLVDDHQEDEEHLRGGDHRDDVGNQLAVALAIEVNRDRAEDRQQGDPEHDRAVEPAPGPTRIL